MFSPTQSADRACYGRVEIGPGACDHARGKSGCVELMLGVQNQRSVHRPHPRWRRRLAMQQMQKMLSNGIIIRSHFDASMMVGIMVPVEQYGAETG